MSPSCRLSGLALVCAFVFSPGAHAAPSPSSAVFRLPDHYELAATLDARFIPDAAGRVPVRLDFDYPAAGDATPASWRLQVLAPDGSVVRSWIGDALLREGRGAH